MNLETYIADLLYRYDCVIVPNFGGFVTNAKSAKIKKNTFSPPYKQITFNYLLQNNDGLLANYIAQVDKTPYETAVNFINFEVQQWVDKLLNNELELNGLGSLYLINDKVQFEPENEVNYLTSSFGLSQFLSDDIKREKSILVEEKVTIENRKIVSKLLENKRKEYKELVGILEEKSPIYLTPEKRRKTPDFIKYAAIFLLSASALWIGNKVYLDNLEKNQVVIINKNQKEREAKIQTATFVIDTPLPTITLNTIVKLEKYHIIAGAFRNEINADKKVKQLIKDGFDAKIIGKNKWDLTQVAFTSFSSLEKASTELIKIQSNVASDAWLLINE